MKKSITLYQAATEEVFTKNMMARFDKDYASMDEMEAVVMLRTSSPSTGPSRLPRRSACGRTPTTATTRSMTTSSRLLGRT